MSDGNIYKTKMASTKSYRAKMFSLREIDVITEYMQVHLQTLKASHAQGGPGAAQKAAKIWERLAEEVNACGNGPRTVKQIKEKWRNMVKIAKTEVSAEKCSMRKTGGGPARPEMSQTSQSVAGLFQNSASFHGVCTDADTLISEQGCVDSTADPFRFADGNLITSDLLSLSPQATMTNDIPVNMAIASTSRTADDSATQPNHPEGSATVNSGLNMFPSSHVMPIRIGNSQQKNKNHQNRTLKDLQMEYYEKQIQLSESQIVCFDKFAKLADVLIEKFK